MAGWISAGLSITGAVSLAGVWLRHHVAARSLRPAPEPRLALVEVRSESRELVVIGPRQRPRVEREPARAAL